MKKNLLKIFTLGLVYAISAQLSGFNRNHSLLSVTDSELFEMTDAKLLAQYLKNKGVINDSDTILKNNGDMLKKNAVTIATGEDPLLRRLIMMWWEEIAPDEKWVGLTRSQFEANEEGIVLGLAGNYLMQSGVFSLEELNPIINPKNIHFEKSKAINYFRQCMAMVQEYGATVEDVRAKMIADGMLIPLAATDTESTLTAAAEDAVGPAGAGGPTTATDTPPEVNAVLKEMPALTASDDATGAAESKGKDSEEIESIDLNNLVAVEAKLKKLEATYNGLINLEFEDKQRILNIAQDFRNPKNKDRGKKAIELLLGVNQFKI